MNAEFAAADWGSTHLRLWLVAKDGTIIAQHQSDQGATKLQPGEFAPTIQAALVKLQANPTLPLVICGMAGARNGWLEAPYLDLPCKLDQIANHCIFVPKYARKVAMIPGLAQRTLNAPDVMRGEETIMLGAEAQGIKDGQFCLPGTHAKWVQLEGGTVTGFTTAMTGELFALLGQHSTLAPFLDFDAPQNHDAMFNQAVEQALAKPAAMYQKLFCLRAGALLLDHGSNAERASQLSGWLLGLELAGLDPYPKKAVHILADGVLAERYRQALAIAGIDARLQSASALVQQGLIAVGRALFA